MLTVEQVKTLRAELLARLSITTPKTASCSIDVNDTLRSVAGRANYSRNLIQLNSRLLNANPNHVIQTVAHELAHLVSVELYGYKLGKGHGPKWKSIMRQFGVSPDRCHKLDTSALKRKHKKWQVYCDCKEHMIGTIRLRKMVRGVKYNCKLCKTNIRLNKPTEVQNV